MRDLEPLARKAWEAWFKVASDTPMGQGLMTWDEFPPEVRASWIAAVGVAAEVNDDRASWIRDAARDLLLARESACPLPVPIDRDALASVRLQVWEQAEWLWERSLEAK